MRTAALLAAALLLSGCSLLRLLQPPRQQPWFCTYPDEAVARMLDPDDYARGELAYSETRATGSETSHYRWTRVNSEYWRLYVRWEPHVRPIATARHGDYVRIRGRLHTVQQMYGEPVWYMPW